MKLDLFKINSLMASNEISKSQLAKKSNISKQWLYMVLGRGFASPKIVNKLAKGLNVPVEEIILKEQ